MKRFFVLMLSLIMVISLIGCGETGKISENFGVAKEPGNTAYESGKIEGSVYTSCYGLTFEKPDNWVYTTEEELASVPMQEGVYYDMLCQDPETGSHVLVMYEDLLAVKGNATVTEEQYIEVVSQSLYGSGFMMVDGGTASVCGKDFEYVIAYGESEDITVQQGSYIRKEDRIMVSVIALAFNGDSLEDIIKCFK